MAIFLYTCAHLLIKRRLGKVGHDYAKCSRFRACFGDVVTGKYIGKFPKTEAHTSETFLKLQTTVLYPKVEHLLLDGRGGKNLGGTTAPPHLGGENCGEPASRYSTAELRPKSKEIFFTRDATSVPREERQRALERWAERERRVERR